jgi:hypothetical protein
LASIISTNLHLGKLGALKIVSNSFKQIPGSLVLRSDSIISWLFFGN